MLQFHISWLGSWIIPMWYLIATYGPRTRELIGTSFKTLGHKPTWWPRNLPRILFLSPASILSSKTWLERSVDITSVKAIILTLLEFYVINTRLLLLWLTLTDLCEESQKTYRKKLLKLSWDEYLASCHIKPVSARETFMFSFQDCCFALFLNLSALISAGLGIIN